MANAPSHTTNAAIKMVTIYNADGKTLNVTRLNALDLIRDGGYFWKVADIDNPRPESDGPKDPSAKTQTVYAEDGTPHVVNSANARDMVGTKKYFWNPPKNINEVEPNDGSVDTITGPVPTTTDEGSVDTITGPVPTSTAEADVVPSEEGLAVQATRVTGSDDVIAYLEGFSEKALRDIAMERYGEKLHHRASKETLITKVIEMEDVRTAGDDQAAA